MKKYIYQELKKQLPLKNNGLNFNDFVTSKMECYIKLIKSEFDTHPAIKFVKDFTEKIPKILISATNGQNGSQYGEFKNLINPLIGENQDGYYGILPVINRSYNDLFELIPDKLNYYFRLTCFEDSIIHIPFHKKNFIRHNRFTFPQIPCFYGGNSLITCIYETGAKIRRETLVSCFEIDYSNTFILDLTMPEFTVNQTKSDYLDKYILSWPIIALCMIQRDQQEDNNIAPEYIIPQFILRLLSENNTTKINAVRYYSTRFDQIENHINIAIPSRSFKDYGYCDDLLNFFRDTDRDPKVPNHLRITRPQFLVEMLDAKNPSFDRIEHTLKNSIEYMKDLM